MADPAPDMLTQALAAYDAGLCVVKAKADGSKRPDGLWTQYQAQRPSRQQVIDWFKGGHPAMGTICGAVSGDLEMFELEGRFVNEITTKKFVEAMMAAGLGDLLKRLRNFLAVSPSGGRHFLYRVEGAVDGNTKLASRDATPEELAANPGEHIKVLIETRGEGGFVMLAPSHGTAHPSGNAWEIKEGDYSTIPTITAEERASLFEVARSFHTATPAPIKPPPPANRLTNVKRYNGTPTDSWFDAAAEHAKQTMDMRELLERYGWEYQYTDRHGRDMLKRPGKTDDGISGSVNENRRLLLFSTSTGFVAYSGPGTPTPTYDQLDVIAYYEHQGDRQAAAKDVATRAGIFAARDRAAAADLLPPITVREPQSDVDPETGEVKAPSHDDLWDQREVFQHIRDAARSRLVSPYAVLGCVLARVAAFTPPTIILPPLVGGTAPLSLYVALHGASGDGKSSPVECAASLIPTVPSYCRGPLPMGSGEGFIESFIERTEEKDDKGKVKRGYKQAYHGILFDLDEGEFLTDVGSRKGSTVLPILRSAWSGKELGQANASAETKRSIAAKRYNIGLVSLWQEDAGLALLGDAVGGTPQRFVWIPTADRTLTRELVKWPGKLDWQAPTINRIGDDWFHHEMDVPQDIVDEIRNYRWDVLQRVITPNPLDSHRNLNKLKISGILAVLDGRRDITHDDWRISERIMLISDAVRDGLVERGQQVAAERVRVEGVKHAIRDAVVEKSARDRALDRAARAAYRACEATDGATPKRAITQRIAGRDREHVTVDEAIAEAINRDWIAGNEASGWRVGKSKPA